LVKHLDCFSKSLVRAAGGAKLRREITLAANSRNTPRIGCDSAEVRPVTLYNLFETKGAIFRHGIEARLANEPRRRVDDALPSLGLDPSYSQLI
jgi:hypothetical protein